MANQPQGSHGSMQDRKPMGGEKRDDQQKTDQQRAGERSRKPEQDRTAQDKDRTFSDPKRNPNQKSGQDH